MEKIKIQHEDAPKPIEKSLVHQQQFEHKFKRVYVYFNKKNIPYLIYSVLGMGLLVSLLIIFNTYVMHLKVETSVVSVPIETMVAPAAGLISQVYVRQGSLVKKDDPLMKIDSIELERDLELAHLQVDDSKLNITYLQSLLINEEKKLNVYKSIGVDRVTSTRASVDAAAQEIVTTRNVLRSMEFLYKKRYVTMTNLDEAKTNFKRAEGKMKNAISQMNIENNALNAVGIGMYFTGQKLEGTREDINAQIEAAKKRLDLNQERVAIYENMLKKLILIAPFDGKVTQILKSAGNTVDSVKPLLLIEQIHTEKKIIAYLTQQEIMHIGISGKVIVYIPSLGKKYFGKVIDVDRTIGFVDEINAQYRWRDLQTDRSAVVTIGIDKLYQDNFNHEVLTGMPAIIYFTRKFNLF
jgi:HlyD family secretion protein